MTDTEKAERLEEVIEAATLAESSMQFNFGVDEVFDELVACSGVPDHLKRKLYFFQSDQYYCLTSTNYIESCMKKLSTSISKRSNS